MKSALRLVRLVCTTSLRVAWSSATIIATFLAWPGAGTRKSTPRLAQARAFDQAWAGAFRPSADH